MAEGYKFVGRSGLKVSNICLGTMTFGDSLGFSGFAAPTLCNKEVAHAILDKYAELGGNFIDTADAYSYGKSEEIIGTWLQKQDREKFVIGTKARIQMDKTNVNKVGLSRRHITEACEESLKRLQTTYIDLYQMHNWDNGTPIEETLRTFDDLVRCGKIRYFGVSNLCGWQMQKVVDTTKMLGLNPVISLQQQYSLLCRQPEWEELTVCRNEGIAVLPWSPLKGGLLTGKFQKDNKPEASNSRIGFIHSDEKMANRNSSPAWSAYANDEIYWNLIETLKTIAKSNGKTVPQISLRWLIQNDVVASVVCGATSVKQIEENMGASAGWKLSEEEIIQLEEASPKQCNYPYDMITKCNTSDRINPYIQ